MSNVFVMDHPLVTHKMSILRDKSTDTKQFREIVKEIAILVGYEATKDLPLADKAVETPLMKMVGKKLDKKTTIVPILRAGLGMVEGVLTIVPEATVGHIGLSRDHVTLQPVEYYCNLPEGIENHEVLLLDPMLATGGSAVAAIDFIKKRGAKNIKFLCVLAVPEGVKMIEEHHPDVDIFIGTMDERLNEKGYILPGLGDAGDRLFGTL